MKHSKFTHIDLFSGIAGFAKAARDVWGDAYENVLFCDNNKFCQEVIRKNFGNGSVIVDDIRKVTKGWLVANPRSEEPGGLSSGGRETVSEAREGGKQVASNAKGKGLQRKIELSELQESTEYFRCDLLTGGFPCQPFSQAGKRGGKSDDRYLWPQMLRIIKEFRPRWIIGENVAGLGTMAQQRGDAPLESQTDNEDGADYDTLADGVLCEIIDSIECLGYTVQAFVIPACSVGAPHRRDRIWIVAHLHSGGLEGATSKRWDGINVVGKDSASAHSTRSVRRAEQGEQPEERSKVYEGSNAGGRGSSPHPNDTGNRTLGDRTNGDRASGYERQEELAQRRTDGHDRPSPHALRLGQRGRGGQERDPELGGRVQQEEPAGRDVRGQGQGCRGDVADAGDKGLQGGKRRESFQKGRAFTYGATPERGRNPQWKENWTSAAARLCFVDDELSRRLVRFPDGRKISYAKWREEALKSAGNAIVPAVVSEIMQAIKRVEEI